MPGCAIGCYWEEETTTPFRRLKCRGTPASSARRCGSFRSCIYKTRCSVFVFSSCMVIRLSSLSVFGRQTLQALLRSCGNASSKNTATCRAQTSGFQDGRFHDVVGRWPWDFLRVAWRPERLPRRTLKSQVWRRLQVTMKWPTDRCFAVAERRLFCAATDDSRESSDHPHIAVA